MANYFRWKKGKRVESVSNSDEKPRSRSLDPRSLELSGIKVVAQRYQQKQPEPQQQQVFLALSLRVQHNFCTTLSLRCVTF